MRIDDAFLDDRGPARRAPRIRFGWRLAVASVTSAAAVVATCAVGLHSLRDVAAISRLAVERQVDLIDEGAAFQSLLYQKGFVANYLLTGDPSQLAQLQASRAVFAPWLQRQRAAAIDEATRGLLARVESAYDTYDEGRKRVLALAGAGREEDAKAAALGNQLHMAKLADLVAQWGALARARARESLQSSEQTIRRLAWVLVLTSLAGAVASALVGLIWARRFARPIYDLQLKIESAAQRTRISVDSGHDGLAALGDRVTALVEKIEEADATLNEQRHRLLQGEKMSAVGEIATKLAHEILNPLAGIKAAAQLLARSGDAKGVATAAEAIDREVVRVDALLRRLIAYARPLAPETRICSIASLLDAAVEGARTDLQRAQVSVERREDPSLPPIEVDPLLMTQVLVNLLANAAQAMAPEGGRIVVRTRREIGHGRDDVVFEVSDEGPGIAVERMGQLFHPFFTTKIGGNGLGLAVSHNIVLEHGGRLAARNREDRRGAVFDVFIPILR